MLYSAVDHAEAQKLSLTFVYPFKDDFLGSMSILALHLVLLNEICLPLIMLSRVNDGHVHRFEALKGLPLLLLRE